MKNITKLSLLVLAASAFIGTDTHAMQAMRAALQKTKTLVASRFARRTAGAVALGTVAVAAADKGAQALNTDIIPGASYIKIHRDGDKKCRFSSFITHNVAWQGNGETYKTYLQFPNSGANRCECKDHGQEYEQYKQRYQQSGLRAAYARWRAGIPLNDAFSSDRLKLYTLYVTSFYNRQGKSMCNVPEFVLQTAEDRFQRASFVEDHSALLNRLDPNAKPQGVKGIVQDCIKTGRHHLVITDKNGRMIFDMTSFDRPSKEQALAEVAKYVDISNMSIEDKSRKNKWFGLF
jgi:hypothetical protein